jgi:hypothetical protein
MQFDDFGFTIKCPKTNRRQKVTFADRYVETSVGYYDSIEIDEVDIYLRCDCGETHTVTLPPW